LFQLICVVVLFVVIVMTKCWSFCRRFDRLLHDVTICLVGKYTRLQDSYASVIKALSHAAMACNYKLDLKVCFCYFGFYRVAYLHMTLIIVISAEIVIL